VGISRTSITRNVGLLLGASLIPGIVLASYARALESGRRSLGMRVALLLALIWTMSAEAAFYSANELYLYLVDFRKASSRDDTTAFIGAGYVVGVFDSGNGRLWCAGDQVSVRQIIDITFDYLDQHPESGRFEAASIVREALSDAYPCEPSK
jgi:hypothetical protein